MPGVDIKNVFLSLIFILIIFGLAGAIPNVLYSVTIRVVVFAFAYFVIYPIIMELGDIFLNTKQGDVDYVEI